MYLDIFKQLNQIPRASHHEERVADFLCDFAAQHGLSFERDMRNCVVIRKPASPGYEDAEPVVILNHMDMVCVARDGYLRDGRAFDPLNDEIRAYVEEEKQEDGSVVRWMKAEGTSLGADNGIGLSMALAILADNSLQHPALEVLTTTNEEDGMSGAEGLSLDFIKGRRIVNLDSEAYDEITVGAAGAYLQVAHWNPVWRPVPAGRVFYRVVMDGGLGGHSGVDINKGRCNCIKALCHKWSSGKALRFFDDILICAMNGGTANAAIASCAEVVIAILPEKTELLKEVIASWDREMSDTYANSDPSVHIRMEPADPQENYLENAPRIIRCLYNLSFLCGPLWMRKDMRNTVMTSNNIGVMRTSADDITVSCHTRSFSNEEMHQVAARLHDVFVESEAEKVECLMDTGSWMEREDSPLLELTCKTFQDVLGFEPKRVAMHFVLEAAYYVEKYPGVEMASIGPRIIEPHSASERIDLDTADNIWRVTVELLKRLKG